MISRRPFLLAAVMGGVTLLAGCASPGTGQAGGTAAAHLAAKAPTPPDLTVTPADGAAQVPLDATITVSSGNGSVGSVAVTRTGGATVAGSLSTDGHTWTASDGLDPAATYVVRATASDTAGARTTATTTFHTLQSVRDRLLTTTSPPDGSTVGVGRTLDLSFNYPIAASQQAEIASRLQVVSVPTQPGAWHWFSPTVIHYRPENYWAPGTVVTLNANLHGVNAGNGVWGLAGFTQQFTVGAKHVSLINDTTHTMQVYSNDQLLYTWPVSLGKAGFRTLNGTLQVLYKVPVVNMSSCATFGGAACIPGNVNYYKDPVYDDTAISTNGFFIHAAPWSVGQQGSVDVSHGCVNLSTARAVTFYGFSIPGDVVVVSGSPNIADYSNGEADWQIPFAQFDNTGSAPTTTPAPSTAGGL
ncbi:MAG: Ig-like domain-containing protein [Candidatus Dormibacteraeota bacterium]|nr:Ig-like domain-containing protein [Candidatus Dormibacteraeota bacterium]